MAIAGIILGAGTDKVIHPFYAQRSPLFFPATVTVINEQALKYRIYVIVNEMVDYSVAEISRKNFPLDRFENYKTNTWADLICSIFYFFVKFKNFSLMINFKRQGVHGISLVFARVAICLKQIVQKLFVGRHLHGFHKRKGQIPVLDTTNRKTVRPIIAIHVRIAAVEVQVVGVSAINRRTPVVTVATNIVERRIVVVAVAACC